MKFSTWITPGSPGLFIQLHLSPNLTLHRSQAGPLPASKHTLLMPANGPLSSLTHTHSSHILTQSPNILHTHTFIILPNPAKSFFPSDFFRSPLKTSPASLQPCHLLPSHHLLCTRLLALHFVGSSQTALHYEVSCGCMLSLSRCVICSCVSKAHSTEFGASEDTWMKWFSKS